MPTAGVAKLVWLLPICLMTATRAQEPSFRASVDTVVVHATVRDSSGRLVPDLDADAFQLLEDGRPVELAVFSRNPQPLSIAIMLDTSMSMSGWGDVPDAPNGIRAFLQALGPADRASIGTFGVEIAVGANLTSDRAELLRVLEEEVWKGGGTPLWEAIRAASRSLAREPGRRVVLLLTDGHDSGGLPGFDGGRSGAERQALADGCMVYAVGFSAPMRERLPGALVDLTEATGGGQFVVPRGGELARTFEHLADELRQQYQLGFVPSARDGQAHRLQVRVNRPGLTATARRNFVAPVGQ
jgi:Ca-activated chloride channel family protein